MGQIRAILNLSHYLVMSILKTIGKQSKYLFCQSNDFFQSQTESSKGWFHTTGTSKFPVSAIHSLFSQ